MVEKLAIAPSQTVTSAGNVAVVLAFTVNTAALVVAVPHVLLKTARYRFPFCEVSVAKVNVPLVAPGISVNEAPPFIETCHWTAVLPFAAALKLANAPSHTAVSVGLALTAGAAFTVNVAAVVVAVAGVASQVLEKTARY